MEYNYADLKAMYDKGVEICFEKIGNNTVPRGAYEEETNEQKKERDTWFERLKILQNLMDKYLLGFDKNNQ